MRQRIRDSVHDVFAYGSVLRPMGCFRLLLAIHNSCSTICTRTLPSGKRLYHTYTTCSIHLFPVALWLKEPIIRPFLLHVIAPALAM